MRIKTPHIGLIVTFLAFCFLLISFREKETRTVINSKDLMDKVLDAIANVKTMRYKLHCHERIKGRMQYFESQVKLQVSPRKLYLSLKGPEVLWVQGTNNGDALVNPAAFPYMNLNLDPYGSLMRKVQHHTIHEMGFQYLADILKDAIKKSGDKFDKYFSIYGEDLYFGKPCYKLSISFPDFAWNSYTVKSGENLTTIARKLKVSEYMVLTNNPKITWYNDVKEGQIIKVPNAYAKSTLLLIDKETFLPISNTVFDDQGLYEKYEYVELQINCVILPEEFTRYFKGYNF